MQKVICPSCNQEAQKGYYENTYVCDCQGSVEEIQNLPTIGGSTIKYEPSMKILIQKNQSNHQLGTNSYFLEETFNRLLVKGEITNFLDSPSNSEGSFIFLTNILEKTSNALIIDVTNKFRKFYNNIGGKNLNVKFMKPKSIEQAYDKIINEINNYDYIALLNANLLVTQYDIDNPPISHTRIELYHRNYLSKIRTMMTKNSCHLTISSSRIYQGVSLKLDDRLIILNQVSDISLGIKKNAIGNFLDLRVLFDNHNPLKKHPHTYSIQYGKSFIYDQNKDLIKLLVKLNIIKKSTSTTYRYLLSTTLTLSNGKDLVMNDLITAKIIRDNYNVFFDEAKLKSNNIF